MMVESDPTPVPAIGLKHPGMKQVPLPLYSFASLASSGQVQWDPEQAMTI